MYGTSARGVGRVKYQQVTGRLTKRLTMDNETHRCTCTQTPTSSLLPTFVRPICENTCKAGLCPPVKRLDNSSLGKLNIPGETCPHLLHILIFKVVQWKNQEPFQIYLQKSPPTNKPHLYQNFQSTCSISPLQISNQDI